MMKWKTFLSMNAPGDKNTRLLRFGCTLFLGMLLFTTGFQAQGADNTIKIAVFEKPRLVEKQDGKLQGFIVELMRSIAAQNNLEPEFQLYSVGECLHKQEEGKVDLLAGIGYSEKRTETLQFSEETLITTWGQVFTTRQSGINSLLDLEGKNIAYIRRSFFKPVLEKLLDQFKIDANFVKTASYSQMFESLQADKYPACIGDQLYGYTQMPKGLSTSAQIVFHPFGIHIAARRGDPGALLARVDTTLAELKSRPNSLYYTLQKRWFSQSPDSGFPEWIYWSAAALILVVLLVFLWNLSLRRIVRYRTRELRSQHNNLAVTLRSIGDGVITTDTDGNVTRINDIAARLTGWSETEAVGRPMGEIFRIINAVTRDIIPNPAAKVLRDGSIMGLANHTLLLSRSGNEYQISDSAAPIRDGNGTLLGVVVVFRDITEEYRNQSTISRQQQAIRQIMDLVPHLIYVKDTDGNFLLTNKAVSEFLQTSADNLSGKRSSLFAPGNNEADSHSSLYSDDLSRLQKENETIFEEHLRDRKGNEHILQTSILAFTDISSGQPAFLVVSLDISRERSIQEQLHQSQKLEALGHLAGGVAHDFNNLLTGILGAAEILRDRVQGEKENQFIEMILSTVYRAAELVNKLLGFSRKSSLKLEPVELQAVAEDVISLLESSIDKRIDISKHWNAKHTTVMGDYSQLQNAILNICINACDAMSSGGILTLSSDNVSLDPAYCKASPFSIEAGEYIQLSIRDTGQGIDQETQKKVFEPFFTTKETGKGTGLGLSTVFGTIEQHHGTITLYSEVGEGTVFHLYLPIASQPEKSISDQEHEAHRGEGLILVVDDEEVIRKTARYMLESLGYQVITAENGEEGVGMFRQHNDQIRLIILDMVMPRMNGREAFHTIRNIDPEARVLLSSGFTQGNSTEELMEEGLLGFLKKPYMKDELGLAVEKALNS